MMRVAAIAPALGLLYCLTLASADPVDFATGTLLGAVLLLALGRRLRSPARTGPAQSLHRAAWFPVFACAVVADVLAGTWDVALRVLHLRSVDRPGLVRVPFGPRTDRGVAVSALATTLSPGSVVVEIDEERREFLLHVIDASDADAVRAQLQRFYDRYQRRVFP